MNWRLKSSWLIPCLFIVALQSLTILVLIPAAGSLVGASYNLNRYADGYDTLAANLAEGNGYRFYPDTAKTLMREPGYPLLLAGIFIAFGKSLTAVKLINMTMTLAVAYLMTRIARKLSSSRLVILGSALLFLFHPETLIAESRGGVEVLFTLMLMLYILTVYRALQTNRWWDYLISGGVLGLTVMVRSTPILFPLVLLGYLLLVERRRGQELVVVRNIIVMVIAMFVVLSPWIRRNYLLTAKFVPTASVLGVAAQTGLYLSTHHEIGNALVDTDAARERNRLAQELGYHFRPGYYQYFYSSADEVAFSNYLFRRVVDQYERSPLLFARTVAFNSFNFWCAGKTWKSVALDAIIQLPLVALAGTAIVLCLGAGRFKDVGLLTLLIIYIVAVSVPILAQARYCAPVIPYLSILACMALVAALRRFSGANGTLHEAVCQPSASRAVACDAMLECVGKGNQ